VLYALRVQVSQNVRLFSFSLLSKLDFAHNRLRICPAHEASAMPCNTCGIRTFCRNHRGIGLHNDCPCTECPSKPCVVKGIMVGCAVCQKQRCINHDRHMNCIRKLKHSVPCQEDNCPHHGTSQCGKCGKHLCHAHETTFDDEDGRHPYHCCPKSKESATQQCTRRQAYDDSVNALRRLNAGDEATSTEDAPTTEADEFVSDHALTNNEAGLRDLMKERGYSIQDIIRSR
jgi:hypothetical protein